MEQITTIGLDLAKNVFQLHGVTAQGEIRLRRQLRRSQMLAFFQRLEPCLIGMEACAGAHCRTKGAPLAQRAGNCQVWA
jgi:transposase